MVKIKQDDKMQYPKGSEHCLLISLPRSMSATILHSPRIHIPKGTAHMRMHQTLCWLGHTVANQTDKDPHLLGVCPLMWSIQTINKIHKGKYTYI